MLQLIPPGMAISARKAAMIRPDLAKHGQIGVRFGTVDVRNGEKSMKTRRKSPTFRTTIARTACKQWNVGWLPL